MKKAIPVWQMGGFVFTAVAGTLLHFLFDWTGSSLIVALFSAVNESIWEHLKLLFYPAIAVAVVEYLFWGKENKSFWCTKLIGIAVGVVMIPMLYYTYTGALGVKVDWFNITIFFVVAALVYWLETKLFLTGFSCRLGDKPAVGLICVMAVAFTILTFVPPHIPLFQDPITESYGFCV